MGTEIREIFRQNENEFFLNASQVKLVIVILRKPAQMDQALNKVDEKSKSAK